MFVVAPTSEVLTTGELVKSMVVNYDDLQWHESPSTASKFIRGKNTHTHARELYDSIRIALLINKKIRLKLLEIGQTQQNKLQKLK
jgi:hypothetical protein